MLTCAIFSLFVQLMFWNLVEHLLWSIRNRLMKLSLLSWWPNRKVKQYDSKQRKLFYSQRRFCKNNFFTEQFLLRYFSKLVCFNQNSASKSGNNSIFWFLLFSVYCYCGDRSIFSANLKDSLMIYICGKFELPNYKSKVEKRTSSFSLRITVQRWRHSRQ